MAPINPVLHQLMAKAEEETPSKRHKSEHDAMAQPTKAENNAGLMAADVSPEISAATASAQ